MTLKFIFSTSATSEMRLIHTFVTQFHVNRFFIVNGTQNIIVKNCLYTSMLGYNYVITGKFDTGLKDRFNY